MLEYTKCGFKFNLPTCGGSLRRHEFCALNRSEHRTFICCLVTFDLDKPRECSIQSATVLGYYFCFHTPIDGCCVRFHCCCLLSFRLVIVIRASMSAVKLGQSFFFSFLFARSHCYSTDCGALCTWSSFSSWVTRGFLMWWLLQDSVLHTDALFESIFTQSMYHINSVVNGRVIACSRAHSKQKTI